MTFEQRHKKIEEVNQVDSTRKKIPCPERKAKTKAQMGRGGDMSDMLRTIKKPGKLEQSGRGWISREGNNSGMCGTRVQIMGLLAMAKTVLGLHPEQDSTLT